MKITFCTYDNPTFHGGPNSWLKRLLPGLKKLGYEIEVIFFFEGELNECPTHKFFTKLDFKIYSYPYRSYATDKIKWILNTVSKSRPDIFVPNMLVHAFYASRWVKQAGIPTVGLIHSDDSFHQGIIEEFVVGSAQYRLSAIVCVSQFLKKKVDEHQPIDILVRKIPYGVPTDAYKNPDTIEGKQLIFVGRLEEEQKRISELTKAFCQVVKRVPNTKATIYGEGEREKVQRLIDEFGERERVQLGIKISSESIQAEMLKSEIIVLLSDYEGLPISLLEAMACGLIPVCLQMESGIPELIEHEKTGLIVANREEDFYKAIQRLSTDTELCRQLSVRARQRIVDHYSNNAALCEWDRIFKELKKETQSKLTHIPYIFSLPKPNVNLLREDFRASSLYSIIKKKVMKMRYFFVKRIKNQEK